MDSKITTNKSTIDTLFYYVFGCTPDDDTGVIIDSIVLKAYSDSTNQGAFNTLLDDKNLKELAKIAKKETIDYLKKELYEYRSKEEDFQNWHSSVCHKIIGFFKCVNTKKELFSYGNSQKLLNMSLKYLEMFSRISGYCELKSDFRRILSAINDDSSCFNIPIDSFILDALCIGKHISYNTLNELKNKGGFPKSKDIEYVVRPSDYIKGWSTWNDSDYFSLCKDVSGKIPNPIEWEKVNWIKESKNKKAKKRFEMLERYSYLTK